MMKDAKLNGKNSLEVESWLKVLGGECDCQRVGGRVVSKKSLKQRHRHLRDDKGPNNETVDHEGGESKSGGEEKKSSEAKAEGKQSDAKSMHL